ERACHAHRPAPAHADRLPVHAGLDRAHEAVVVLGHQGVVLLRDLPQPFQVPLQAAALVLELPGPPLDALLLRPELLYATSQPLPFRLRGAALGVPALGFGVVPLDLPVQLRGPALERLQILRVGALVPGEVPVLLGQQLAQVRDPLPQAAGGVGRGLPPIVDQLDRHPTDRVVAEQRAPGGGLPLRDGRLHSLPDELPGHAELRVHAPDPPRDRPGAGRGRILRPARPSAEHEEPAYQYDHRRDTANTDPQRSTPAHGPNPPRNCAAPRGHATIPGTAPHPAATWPTP